MLTVIDEYTRESLAIQVGRRLRSDDVLHCLTELFTERGLSWSWKIGQVAMVYSAR